MTLNSTVPPTFCHLHLRKHKTLAESKSPPILWYLHDQRDEENKETKKKMIGSHFILHKHEPKWTLMLSLTTVQLLGLFTVPSLFHIFYSKPPTSLPTATADILVFYLSKKTKASKRPPKLPYWQHLYPYTLYALPLVKAKIVHIVIEGQPRYLYNSSHPLSS